MTEQEAKKPVGRPKKKPEETPEKQKEAEILPSVSIQKLEKLAETRGVEFAVDGFVWTVRGGEFSDSGNINIPEIAIMRSINNIAAARGKRYAAPSGMDKPAGLIS